MDVVLLKNIYIKNCEHGSRPVVLCCGGYITVGQRKKVAAVTFFPARPRPDQRGTDTGQMHKAPVDEIAGFFVYRMGETRSHLSANNGILVYLVREICQFKVFAGRGYM